MNSILKYLEKQPSKNTPFTPINYVKPVVTVPIQHNQIKRRKRERNSLFEEDASESGEDAGDDCEHEDMIDYNKIEEYEKDSFLASEEEDEEMEVEPVVTFKKKRKSTIYVSDDDGSEEEEMRRPPTTTVNLDFTMRKETTLSQDSIDYIGGDTFENVTPVVDNWMEEVQEDDEDEEEEYPRYEDDDFITHTPYVVNEDSNTMKLVPYTLQKPPMLLSATGQITKVASIFVAPREIVHTTLEFTEDKIKAFAKIAQPLEKKFTEEIYFDDRQIQIFKEKRRIGPFRIL
jgi:hypothetical protein